MLIEEIREVRRQVRDYLVSSFYVPDPGALADSASLIETGVIDSTGALELVAFLESTFGVRIGDEEMLPENLDSIARVAAFVCRKRLLEELRENQRQADDRDEPRGGAQVGDAGEVDHGVGHASPEEELRAEEGLVAGLAGDRGG